MRESFQVLPRSSQFLILLLMSFYVLVAFWISPHVDFVVAAGLIAVFAGAAIVQPIPNPSGGQIYPSNSVKIVSALLWLPPDVFLGVGVGSFLGLLLFRRYEVWRAAINGAGWGLAAAAATLAVDLVTHHSTNGIGLLGIAAILAVVTNRGINEGIFSIYRAQRFGHPFFPTWVQNLLDQWPSQLFAAPIGIVLAATAVHLGSMWWGLALTALSAIALPIPRQELAYYHRAQQMLDEIVEAMVRALEGVDSKARSHGDRVSRLAVAVGRRLGMSEQKLRALDLASRLHDVGILARLEGEPMQQSYTSVSRRILSGFPDPLVAAIVCAHHERWDGKGLPDHLRGNAIPLGARILAAAEIYDSAVAGMPPFESALTRQEAFSHVISLAGTVLDPKIVMALIAAARDQQPDGAVG